jgi:stalled ribosome rescue protein Dom34
MGSCVVWVDSVHAKVFKLSVAGVKRKIIHINATHPNSEESFFQDVMNEIGEPPERLLIMGSGTTKNDFKKFLEKYHKDNLLESLVGVEPLPDVNDLQILEASRRYFKKHSDYSLSM